MSVLGQTGDTKIKDKIKLKSIQSQKVESIAECI